MDRPLNIKFKEFAIENLSSIPHPTSKNKFLELKEISTLSDLLFSFINYKVEESSLQRIKSNFEFNFEKIFNLDKEALPLAIEGLATNFESFLKKIAFLKFDNALLWNGDGIFKGIKKCTLFELIESKSTKIDINSIGEDFKSFPTLLINNSGTSKAILDFVRVEIRNAVHSANSYNRAQLIRNSNYVLSTYLIAINDNLEFFKKKFFQEFLYLENIVNNKEFDKLDQYYVDLYGKEESFHFENIAIEQLDGQKLIDSINFNELENDVEDNDDVEEDDDEIVRIDSVINISRDTQKFIITGEPGSGKTTCLQKILFENAKNVLIGIPKCRFPIYIKASSYSTSKSFFFLIINAIGEISLEDLLSRYTILLLIDGLNEIEDEFKRIAFNELKELILKYEKIHFIITSRKFGFVNYFNLNDYELKKLDEKQIQQLIKNVSGQENGSFLWNQVEKNRQILDLASNPLSLMMIIKVSSLTHNIIPQNKGLLYKIFNDAILVRERKHYDTDLSSKKDVLSHVAFWMRNNGIFKTIKKVKVKELIKEKLNELKQSIGVNNILNELSDNNFFIERNDELEFYHETQQEYFAALEIQNIFFKNKNFEFDYSDSKWFEPMLICSDLFIKEEDIIEFFELIFIGQKNPDPKPLQFFTDTDINNNFFIACKIAFNLKNTHPILFKRAENYLGNYLVMWHIKFPNSFSDLSYLTKGVASLSSEIVFKKFFLSLKNLEILFYNEFFDKRIENSFELERFDNKFKLFLKDFNENLNDFTTLYKVLMLGKTDFDVMHILSRSVYKNLKIFSRYIIAGSSTSQLAQSFKETKSLEILNELGKSDLNFFIDNYFSTKDATKKKFYSFIIKYHIRSIGGIDFLIKTLKTYPIDNKIKLAIIEEILLTNDHLDIAFIELRNLLDSDMANLLEDVQVILNKYPLVKLNTYGLANIFNSPTIEKINIQLKLIDQNEYQSIFECNNNNISHKDINSNLKNFVFNGEFINFERHYYPQIYSRTVVILNGLTSDIDECLKKYFHGGSFTFYYLDYRNRSQGRKFIFRELYRSNSANQLFAEVDDYTLKSISDIFRKITTEIKVLVGQEFSFSIIGFMNFNTRIFLSCKTEDLKNFKIDNGNLLFELSKIEFDFSKPYIYHRDLISHNIILVRHIRLQLEKYDVLTFIRKIGLCFLYSKDLKDPNLGLVTYVNTEKEFYYVVRFINGKALLSTINNFPEQNIKPNDVVLIESNLNISKVTVDSINQDCFLESEIIYISNEYKEGFIKAINSEKDYYFLFQHCNFFPSKSMQVKFIPGTNFAKNNSQRPMAYWIHLVNNSQKLCKVIKIKKRVGFQDVLLKDENNNQKLFTRISAIQKIINFDGNLSIGDIFSYRIPEKYKDLGGIKRVYLQSKMNK